MAEILISLQIKPLEEGGYLATSNELQGLVAQGRTVAETMEIAQDVARKLIECCIEHGDPLPLSVRRGVTPPRKKRETMKIPVASASCQLVSNEGISSIFNSNNHNKRG